MKILCLADLHRLKTDRIAMAEQNDWIKGLLRNHPPDVVMIAGDVFESRVDIHPYEELAMLFADLPVVCTLGNHEFWYRTVSEVLGRYQDLYDPAKWNVHYLDVVGSFDIGNVHVFGNVLWFDGSMSTVPGQNIDTFAEHRWRDYEIKDFDWRSECANCIEQIKANQPEERQTGVLLTHAAPHSTLNGHMAVAESKFNAYSGVSWLLDEIRADYAICGHTHYPVVEKTVNGIQCTNIGNDYWPPFKSHFLEITGRCSA